MLHTLKPLLSEQNFSLSGMQKIYHLLECHSVDINASLIFLLRALPFLRHQVKSMTMILQTGKETVLTTEKVHDQKLFRLD